MGIERSEPSLNVSREELNQSYQEQLERRISDQNMALILLNKELEERRKQEAEDPKTSQLQEQVKQKD